MRLVEKYRPKSFSEVRGQKEVIGSILGVLNHEYLPHFLFLGPPGCGKTSIAQCLADARYGDQWRNHFIELNASDERRIETVRGKIKNIASTRGDKFLFLDEADNMTPDAQQAMRRIMEKTRSTVFILSGNREHKIIDPIKSRCAIYRFKRLSDEDVLRRLLEICKAEGIRIDKDAREGFTRIAKEARGDMRKAINTLEKLVGEGKEITEKNVIMIEQPSFAGEALKMCLSGNFERGKEMLEDAYINSRFDTEHVIGELFRMLGEWDSEVVKDEVKIRLYSRLSETERNIRLGGTPLIQLVGFLAYAWIVPHLPASCPALSG